MMANIVMALHMCVTCMPTCDEEHVESVMIHAVLAQTVMACMVVALHMCVVCMSTCDEEHVECAREYDRVRGDVLAQRLVEHAAELVVVQHLLCRVHAKRDSPRVIEQLVDSACGDGAPLGNVDIYV